MLYLAERCGGYRYVDAWAKYDWSPRYIIDDPAQHFYPEVQSCNWLIEAPQGKRVVLEFESDFGIYCYNDRCLDWVEVRYKTDLGMSGPR